MSSSANCFGIPDTYKGWEIHQGPDDLFYASVSGASWDDLRETLDSLPAALSPQGLDAATVERCAIRDYLTACAAVADTQAERFAGHDASIVAACRAEAKAYHNAARMIEAQDHASRREQIAAALATEPHQHGGKGA